MQSAKNVLHGLFPVVGAARFGVPGEYLEIIGITGTDGKSSSVELTAAMLRAAGHRVAHFSTVSYHDGFIASQNTLKMTTPGRMELHRFLRRAIENGCTHAVIEVTSQGIMQHRHRMIGFSLVALTNITPEHIEAHGGFDQYRAAKASIVHSLKTLSRGLVITEQAYKQVASLIPREIRVHRIDDGALHARILETRPHRSIVELERGSESVRIESPLGGPFAADNVVFSAHIASQFDVSLAEMQEAVAAIQCIPGRFEIISSRPLIIVDYGHTMHALEVLLPYVRLATAGKLVHVFGAAGGGRDRYKRPLIARLSEKNVDVSVITEENSFDEPVEMILNDIQTGFSSSHTVYRRERREDAVRLGYSLLNSDDDTLLLTAKGSETVIAGPRGERRAYTERDFIRCIVNDSSDS